MATQWTRWFSVWILSDPDPLSLVFSTQSAGKAMGAIFPGNKIRQRLNRAYLSARGLKPNLMVLPQSTTNDCEGDNNQTTNQWNRCWLRNNGDHNVIDICKSLASTRTIPPKSVKSDIQLPVSLGLVEYWWLKWYGLPFAWGWNQTRIMDREPGHIATKSICISSKKYHPHFTLIRSPIEGVHPLILDVEEISLSNNVTGSLGVCPRIERGPIKSGITTKGCSRKGNIVTVSKSPYERGSCFSVFYLA